MWNSSHASNAILYISINEYINKTIEKKLFIQT